MYSGLFDGKMNAVFGMELCGQRCQLICTISWQM